MIPTVFRRLMPTVLLLALAGSTSTWAKAEVREMSVNVTNFEAKGDGVTDDTAAFQKALDDVSKRGGGVVSVPTGRYLIKGNLSVPDAVTLEGVWKLPPSNEKAPLSGSVLLAVEGSGKADATPFISLNTDSGLKGVTIFYPEQDNKNPRPYPWTVRGHGVNMSIIDVLMVNPWQAVDFGTNFCGRHLIRGLYAGAFHRGIFVDNCLDVGRIEDVHLWPFYGPNPGARKAMKDNGIAFIFGKTDWEYVTNCFAFGYGTGFVFQRGLSGQPGNVILTQSGSDESPVCVRVERAQPHSGIAFSNCQMMGTVVTTGDNNGPLKFANCGFWPVSETDSFALLEGHATVTFTGCHFYDWGRKDANSPGILAKNGALIVSSCDFMSGKPKITLEKDVISAVIYGNRMRGGEKITNNSKGKVKIDLNVDL